MPDDELLALVDANLVELRRRRAASAARAASVASVTSASAAGTSPEPGDPGYGLWTRAHADAGLEAVLPMAGFRLAVDLPVMILDERPEARPVPAGSEIRRVVDADGIADGRVAAFVAYVDGVPAARASSFTALGVVRIDGVETSPGFRRRGLGEAVTRAAAIAGFEGGARLAALEASAEGEPMYRAMGFREISRYRIWTIG